MVVNTPTANANSPQISQQGIELYKRMLEDTVFIKRQQWATTNYAALIYAAIIWLSQHTATNPLLRCVLFVVTILVGAIASALLIKFQCELAKLRGRIQSANNYSFGTDERSAFDIKDREEGAFTRGGHILLALIAVAVIGAILTIAAILSPVR